MRPPRGPPRPRAISRGRRTTRWPRQCAARPDRFAGYRELRSQYQRRGAAAEFERCVTVLGLAGVMIDGTTDGLFLDDPRFEPVLATAERLGFPIYLHPAPPPGPVFKAYFSGLPEAVARSLSISGYGWHAEMGFRALRLIVAGVFDRFPGLQVIIGHMGEFIPYCLAAARPAAGTHGDPSEARDRRLFPQQFPYYDERLFHPAALPMRGGSSWDRIAYFSRWTIHTARTPRAGASSTL